MNWKFLGIIFLIGAVGGYFQVTNSWSGEGAMANASYVVGSGLGLALIFAIPMFILWAYRRFSPRIKSLRTWGQKDF